MFVELQKDFLGQKAGARIDLEEGEAKTLIDSKIAKTIEGDPLGPIISKSVGGMIESITKSMDSAITETLKKHLAAQQLSSRNASPILFGANQDQRDPHGKSFGDYLYAVARKDTSYLEKHYGSQFNAPQTKAAMAESSGVTGGYTVPPDFYHQLMALVAENSFIRPRAFVVPMASASTQIPYLDVTTAQTAGVTPFFGGVTMNWTGEAQTRTETEPTFKQMELKAWELSGYSVSSNVLLQDSAFGLEKFLMNLFAMSIAWFEEYAFLVGNGVGKPQGMKDCNAAIALSRNTASHVYFADVAGMWAKLLPASWGKAIWCFSPSVIPELLQLKDGSSRAIFISIDQGAVKGPNWSLLGRPALPTEKIPALGTKGDLMLLDPSLYVIGDRMSVEIASSEHVNFLKNQMTWRVVERVDGQPWLDGAITLQDATTQVSPFVVLN
jgi:HK97 family phage major capsid protein